MDAVLRGLLIYFFLLIVFSIAGKRSLAEMDTFDFILLLIISEAAQNALTGENYSITFAALLIITLVVCELFMSWLRTRKPKIETYMEGGPVIIVKDGKTYPDRMKKEFITDSDILSAGRLCQGLERMDQIKWAILETSGEISIIPK